MARCTTINKRTALHDRVLEWETPAEELGVGQSVNGARRMFKKIALGGQTSDFTSALESAAGHDGRTGARSTRNSGDEGNQGWDEGENPHST